MDQIIKKQLVKNWFKTLQEVLCKEIEELEGRSNLFKYNNWERGKAGEHRADGSFVPYVKSDGDHIPIKEFADNRSKYEGMLRDRKNKQQSTK